MVARARSNGGSEFDDGGYQGTDWGIVLALCLIAAGVGAILAEFGWHF
jgi:hypothetical protein